MNEICEELKNEMFSNSIKQINRFIELGKRSCMIIIPEKYFGYNVQVYKMFFKLYEEKGYKVSLLGDFITIEW